MEKFNHCSGFRGERVKLGVLTKWRLRAAPFLRPVDREQADYGSRVIGGHHRRTRYRRRHCTVMVQLNSL